MDGVLTSGAGAASWGDGRLDVFVRNTEGGLSHRWFEGGWSGWEALRGGPASTPAAVSRAPGRLSVFYRGRGDDLREIWLNGEEWQPILA